VEGDVEMGEVQFESAIVAPENVATVPWAPVHIAIGGLGRRGAGPGRQGGPGGLPAGAQGAQAVARSSMSQ
jgi:hypothetical protein